MREFRYSKVLIIFSGLGVILCLLIGGGVFIAAMDDVETGTAVLLIVVAISLVLFGILSFIEILLTRVTISDQYIKLKSLFTKRSLPMAAVKGYRHQRSGYLNTIVLHPIETSFKKIQIPSWLSNSSEVNEWILSRFDDLDRVEEFEERQRILNDPTSPFDAVDIESRIIRAKRLARGMNIGAFTVMIWAMFIPHPYDLVMIANALYPLLAIFVLRTSKGLIRLNDDESKVLPDISFAILLPGMALSVRAIMDYDLLDHAPLWPLMIAGILILAFLIFYKNPGYPLHKRKSIGIIFLMSALMGFHVYGVVTFINCDYDPHAAVIERAEVVGYRKSSGRTLTYYIEAAPLSDPNTVREFKVTSDAFDRIVYGDTVVMVISPGLFRIRWGYLVEE